MTTQEQLISMKVGDVAHVTQDNGEKLYIQCIKDDYTNEKVFEVLLQNSRMTYELNSSLIRNAKACHPITKEEACLLTLKA